MDTCGTIYKRHDPGVNPDSAHRLTSNETEAPPSCAAQSPVRVWAFKSTSAGRKFKFRPRFADEGLESFYSSESDDDMSSNDPSILRANSRLRSSDAVSPRPLSLARKSPTERITNMKPYDLCIAPQRE
jgi:hypothetical protein